MLAFRWLRMHTPAHESSDMDLSRCCIHFTDHRNWRTLISPATLGGIHKRGRPLRKSRPRYIRHLRPTLLRHVDLPTIPLAQLQHHTVSRRLLRRQRLALLPLTRSTIVANDIPSIRPCRSLVIYRWFLQSAPFSDRDRSNASYFRSPHHDHRSKHHLPQRSPLHLPPPSNPARPRSSLRGIILYYHQRKLNNILDKPPIRPRNQAPRPLGPPPPRSTHHYKPHDRILHHPTPPTRRNRRPRLPPPPIQGGVPPIFCSLLHFQYFVQLDLVHLLFNIPGLKLARSRPPLRRLPHPLPLHPMALSPHPQRSPRLVSNLRAPTSHSRLFSPAEVIPRRGGPVLRRPSIVPVPGNRAEGERVAALCRRV